MNELPYVIISPTDNTSIKSHRLHITIRLEIAQQSKNPPFISVKPTI